MHDTATAQAVRIAERRLELERDNCQPYEPMAIIHTLNGPHVCNLSSALHLDTDCIITIIDLPLQETANV